MPYNFAADSFHTKKLCSRLSSSEVDFLMKIGRFAFCLSVTRVNCDKTVERSVQIYIAYHKIVRLMMIFLPNLLLVHSYYTAPWQHQQHVRVYHYLGTPTHTMQCCVTKIFYICRDMVAKRKRTVCYSYIKCSCFDYLLMNNKHKHILIILIFNGMHTLCTMHIGRRIRLDDYKGYNAIRFYAYITEKSHAENVIYFLDRGCLRTFRQFYGMPLQLITFRNYIFTKMIIFLRTLPQSLRDTLLTYLVK